MGAGKWPERRGAGNAIGPRGLEELCALRRCEALHTVALGLEGNGLGPAGAQALSTLATAKHMQSLARDWPAWAGGHTFFFQVETGGFTKPHTRTIKRSLSEVWQY